MAGQSGQLLRTLKKALKNQGITYKAVAEHLNLSEASVKRLFSQQDMSLQRVEQIAQLASVDWSDLVTLMEEEKEYITTLSHEQENELVREKHLLLTIFLLLNHWKFSEIIETFNLEQHQLTRILAKLDKLRLIELLPNNRVKLLTARNFNWRKNGPVHRFIKEHILTEFLDSRFDKPQQTLKFVGGLLSEASSEKAKYLIEQFTQAFDDLIASDIKLPLSAKSAFGCLMAFRDWEYSSFRGLRRK